MDLCDMTLSFEAPVSPAVRRAGRTQPTIGFLLSATFGLRAIRPMRGEPAWEEQFLRESRDLKAAIQTLLKEVPGLHWDDINVILETLSHCPCLIVAVEEEDKHVRPRLVVADNSTLLRRHCLRHKIDIDRVEDVQKNQALLHAVPVTNVLTMNV
jgi:hypothetical protein